MSREAAERVLRDHATVATGLGEWCCKCLPLQWRPTVHRSAHVAEALDAAGVLGDPAETLRKAARFFEYDMSEAWGGDSSWISTGNHVADLVADILRERADELAEHRGERDGGVG